MSLYDTILYLIATLIGALQALTLYHKTKLMQAFAPYIPIDKSRGFTAQYDNFSEGFLSIAQTALRGKELLT